MTHDTNDTAHSPLPWIIGEYNESNGDLYIESNGCTILSANSFRFDVDKSNAEHIVKCVNNHDALVTALKDAVDSLKYVQETFHGIMGFGVRHERILKAEQALRDAGAL